MALSVCIIGAGRIGLGLLYPWMVSAGNKAVLINRRAHSGSARPYRTALKTDAAYLLKGPCGEWPYGEVELQEYDPDDLGGADSRDAVAAISAANVVLVSVGVANLGQVAYLIAEGCRDAPAETPLHVLAFENRPEASAELERLVSDVLRSTPGAAARPVVSHATVTDRACSMEDVSGPATVKIERYGEVVVADTAASLFDPCEDLADAAPIVTVAPPKSVEFFEYRKFWLVNGTHVVLGILAEKKEGAGFRLVDVLEDPNAALFLRGLHQEWTRVLAAHARAAGCTHPALSEEALNAFSDRIFERLGDQADWTVMNVLREFVSIIQDPLEEPLAHLSKLARLLKKFDDRLARQVQYGRQAGIPTPLTAFALAESIQAVSKYVDRYIAPQRPRAGI